MNPLRSLTAKGILQLAAALCILLSAGIVLYRFAALSPNDLPRRIYAVFGLLPIVVPVLTIQFIPYGSWPRRLRASLIVALISAFAMLLVMLFLGCGLFDGCS